MYCVWFVFALSGKQAVVSDEYATDPCFQAATNLFLLRPIDINRWYNAAELTKDYFMDRHLLLDLFKKPSFIQLLEKFGFQH